jgi:hypothetical protein
MQFRSGLFCSLLAATARPTPEQLGPPFGSLCAHGSNNATLTGEGLGISFTDVHGTKSLEETAGSVARKNPTTNV